MKKFLLSLLLVSMVSVQSFAQTEVQYNAKQLQLKSQLQNQYSAYEISFTNISSVPIKADTIQCLNKINVPDISQSMKLKKGTKWAMALCPFTLGISCIGAMPEISERNKQTSYLLDEQKRYTSYYGESLPVSKAEIQPGETIRYNLLVPLNEQPEITATFQNLKTNKYFNVSEK